MTFLPRKGSMTALAVMLILLFSRSVFANFDAGYNAGILDCQAACNTDCPSTSTTCPDCNVQYNQGKNDGINECKSNPSFYGLKSQFDFDQAWNTRYQEGYTQGSAECPVCQDCNIRYQEGYTQGRAECPACQDCNIRYQDGYNQGKAECPVCQDCNAQYQAGFNTGKQQGIAEGQAACQTCEDCNVQYQAGFNTGKQQGLAEGQASCPVCQTCQDCNVQYQAGYDLGKIDGRREREHEIAFAKQQGIEQGMMQGIEQCQKDPTSCGLDHKGDVANARFEGIQQGKQECRANPSAPGCFVSLVTPEPFPVNICDNKAKNCVSIPPSKLYLPKIEVVGAEGLPLIENAEMEILAADGQKLLFVFNINEVELVPDSGGKNLEIKITGTREGMVVSYPAGIKCGNGNDECQEFYKIGSTVELFAVPKDANSVFSGWIGGCQGSANQLSLTVTADTTTCIATFEPAI